MKFEIDLNDILGDESGVETLQESVHRQVIEKMSYEIKNGIGEKIDSEVAKLINETLKKTLTDLTPNLVEDLMNTEYQQVDRWGDRKDGKTTFRKELVRSINEEMKYKKERYDSDKNTFSKAVDEVIKQNVDGFKENFDSLVNAAFTQEAMTYAQESLKKKLGIK